MELAIDCEPSSADVRHDPTPRSHQSPSTIVMGLMRVLMARMSFVDEKMRHRHCRCVNRST